MARRRSDTMTDTQGRILEAVRAYIRKNDCFPSMRDIGKMVNITSTSHISYTLDALERKGMIDRARGKARSIHLTLHDPQDVPYYLRRIPIMGRIQAGMPLHIPDFQGSAFGGDEHIDVLRGALKLDADCYYALEVIGDSMIDSHVLNGDYVIIRTTGEARNGEMVAARILSTGETTLKHWFLEKDRVRLQPANKDYQPILVGLDDVMIQGVVERIERHPMM